LHPNVTLSPQPKDTLMVVIKSESTLGCDMASCLTDYNVVERQPLPGRMDIICVKEIYRAYVMQDTDIHCIHIYCVIIISIHILHIKGHVRPTHKEIKIEKFEASRLVLITDKRYGKLYNSQIIFFNIFLLLFDGFK
jgi:hypothetical protein